MWCPAFVSGGVRMRMRMCDKTITVYNAHFNPETDRDEYPGTVISGVSWFCAIESTVDKGLQAADKFTVRIPADANFSGKSYVTPKDFQKAANTTGLFTLQNGDIIVYGAAPVEGMTPAVLKRDYDFFTVLGVTDNRRTVCGPHWKVVGS